MGEVWTQEDNTGLLYSWCSGLDHHRLLPTLRHPHIGPASLWSRYEPQYAKLFSSCSSVQVAPLLNWAFQLLISLIPSSDKRRGGFLSLFALMIGLGILATYCLGAVLYWRFVSIIPPVLYLVLFLLLWRVPESPLWLLSHRGTEDCREALQWLRY